MRKIDLTPFPIKGDEEPGEMDKGILVVLFHNPNYRLNSIDLRTACKIMDAIDDALEESKDSVLLENEEHSFLVKVLGKFEGFTRADKEFVLRIEDASEVKVKEA